MPDTVPEIRLVPFEALNPRKTVEDGPLAGLAGSIKAKGILQNLIVRAGGADDDAFAIVGGERRYRAIGRLVEAGDWDPAAATIPVRVVDADDGEAGALALLENLQRVDVPPLEEAAAFRQLQALSKRTWSAKRIAEAIGKTPRHVQLRLALLDKLADDTRAALAEGRITLAQARALTMADADTQAGLVADIAAGTYSRADDIRGAIVRNHKSFMSSSP